MTLYKTYLKLILNSKKTIFIYTVIFVVLLIFSAKFIKVNDEITFESKTSNILIIDEDKSEISQDLIKYIGKHGNIKIIKKIGNAETDLVYNMHYSGIVKIFSGFSNQNSSINIDKIELYSGMDGRLNIINKERISNFIRSFSIYKDFNFDNKNANKLIIKNLDELTKTTLIQSKDVESFLNNKSLTYSTESKTKNYELYGQIASIFIFSVIIYVMGNFYREVNQTKVYNRTLCSSTKIYTINKKLIMFSLLINFMMISIFILLALFLYRNELLKNTMWIYASTNLVTLSILALSISFLFGNIFTNKNAITAANTGIIQFFCFMGGIYIPINVFSKNMKFISSLTPLYWYTKANEIIGNNSYIVGQNLSNFMNSIFIQLMFSIFFFTTAILLKRKYIKEN